MDLDPATAMVIATLMMLLNGGVLGFMHRDLSRDVQPSAFSWRLGTLLLAGGCILVAVSKSLPQGFILPFANSFLLGGVSFYWRAIRQFYHLPERLWLWLPALLGTLGVYWFAAVVPNLGGRIVAASIAWAIMAFAAAWTLHQRAASESAVSRAVLAGILLVMASFMLLRAAYFGLHPAAAATLLDNTVLLNVITPLVAAILPVIGTTAFLLMCSERMRREFERAAATDYLTGLANRRTISLAGKSQFAAARLRSGHFAAAVIDIDHFKRVNDQFGHEVGDLALQHVAGVLQQACGEPHMLGRQGGEEFVVVLAATDAAQAERIGERLRQAVAVAPLQLDRQDGMAQVLPITVSIGVSAIATEDREFSDILRRADQALYAAKSSGRNRVVLGQPQAPAGLPTGGTGAG